MGRAEGFIKSTILRQDGKVLSPGLAGALRLVYGASFLGFVERSARLWRVARGVVRGDVTPALPFRLQVETTDVCNLKCRMCAREAMDDMDTGAMTLETFKRLVDDVDPYYVTLNGLGEPLIDKTIFEKLAHLHSRHAYSSMPTNGSFVEGKSLERLLENMHDVLTVSIDGATKEAFESVRVLANFDNIIANFRKLLERRAAGEGRSGAIRVLCALQKANLFDFKKMYELIKVSLRLEFNLTPVYDYEPGGTIYADLIPSPEEVKEAHRQIDEHLETTRDVAEAEFLRSWKDASAVWLHPEHQVVDPLTNRHSCIVPLFSSYVDAH